MQFLLLHLVEVDASGEEDITFTKTPHIAEAVVAVQCWGGGGGARFLHTRARYAICQARSKQVGLL